MLETVITMILVPIAIVGIWLSGALFMGMVNYFKKK